MSEHVVAILVGGAFGSLVAVRRRMRLSRAKWLAAASIAGFSLTVGCGPASDGGGKADRLLRELTEIPSVAALKTNYPEDYGRLEAKLRALPASAGIEEVRPVVDGALGEVLARQRPKADDTSSLGPVQGHSG